MNIEKYFHIINLFSVKIEILRIKFLEDNIDCLVNGLVQFLIVETLNTKMSQNHISIEIEHSSEKFICLGEILLNILHNINLFIRYQILIILDANDILTVLYFNIMGSGVMQLEVDIFLTDL